MKLKKHQMNRDKLDKGFIKLQTYNDIWVTEGQVPRHRDSLSKLSSPLGLPKEFFLLLRQYEEEMLDAFLQDDDYFSELTSLTFVTTRQN